MAKVKVYKYIGLIIALIIPVFWSVFVSAAHAGAAGAARSMAHYLLGELFYWSLFALLVLIAKYGEKEPIIFFNKNTSGLKTIGMGFLVLISLFVTSLVYRIICHAILKMPAPHEALMDKIYHLPRWLKVMLCARAGIIEETFFRAYAISRLLQLTSNKFVAYFIPLLLFALAHYAYGTFDHMAGAFALGLTLTLWYVKTRNLAANMIGHSLLDMTGLFVDKV